MHFNEWSWNKSISNNLILSEKEIKEIKYDKLRYNIMNNKYTNILFILGAVIGTSVWMPDFRSKTGLFK